MRHGNLLIADTGNHWIRKVTPAGIIGTVAGGGDGWDERRRRSRSSAAPTRQYCGGCSRQSVHCRHGTADPQGDSRRGHQHGGGHWSTDWGDQGFSGDGGPATAAQLSYPRVSPWMPAAICSLPTPRTTASGRSLQTVSSPQWQARGEFAAFSGDGGHATSARLFYPSGVAVDGAGNLFIADSGNNRIRR